MHGRPDADALVWRDAVVLLHFRREFSRREFFPARILPTQCLPDRRPSLRQRWQGETGAAARDEDTPSRSTHAIEGTFPGDAGDPLGERVVDGRQHLIQRRKARSWKRGWRHGSSGGGVRDTTECATGKMQRWNLAPRRIFGRTPRVTDLRAGLHILEPVLIFYFGLRAAPLGWGRRSCPWCKLSPISPRSPGYEPRLWSNFHLSGPRSRYQTKTQTGS